MNRENLASWYRSFARREALPNPAAPASVALSEPRRAFPLKYVLWGLGGAFLLVEVMGTLVSHPGPASKSALTDQGAPQQTTKSGLEQLGIGTPKGLDGDKALEDREAQARRDAAATDARTLQQLQNSGGAPPQTPEQAAAEERKRKDEESLLSSTLIPLADAPEPAVRLSPAPVSPAPAIAAQATPAAASVPIVPSNSSDSRDCVDMVENGVTRFAICEGSIVPAVLDNRIVGEFAGPAKAYLLYDVYSGDRKHVILPRGTVALGKADSVDKQNQRRISVSFHRLILPDGRGIAIDQMLALDQAGETALSGKVNRHLVQTFGTAAIIGALSGFSQFGAGSAYTGSGVDTYRQGVAAGTAQQGQQILQRDLSRTPSITIPEGKAIEIYISSDIHLPEFVSVQSKGADK